MLFAEYADLRIDVASGALSADDANEIAAKRQRLEIGMDEEEHRVASYERSARREVGNNIATKGRGHKTLGARNHGKAMVGLSGAGYGRYSSERLLRIPNGVAAQGRCGTYRPN
jgi:hypothetical protein